jgi:sortase A
MFRKKVENRVKPRAPKLPFSFKRQILPPLTGIIVMASVFGLLNGQYLLAQYRYRFDTPKSVISHSTASTQAIPVADTKIDPSIAPTIRIPAIGVEAPIIDEPTYTEWKVQLALRRGVVHYGQTVSPGQNGNMVVLGHSSGQLWAPGDYKFIFTLLDKLKAGDRVSIDYQGTRYTYEVTGSDIVSPDDLTVLTQTDKPMLSLITCTPVGTSKNRLIVHAKLISPKPTTTESAESIKKSTQPVTATELPGSDHSVSLWQRVRNWF